MYCFTAPLCSSNPSACGVGQCEQKLTPPFYSCHCGNFPSTFSKTLADLVPCEQSKNSFLIFVKELLIIKGACYYQNPCQNGGTCSNQAGGNFKCQCPPRYTGFKCEKQCKLIR